MELIDMYEIVIQFLDYLENEKINEKEGEN